MIRRLSIGTLCILGSLNTSCAQSLENLQDINKTWTKFCRAFETLDHQLMADIHTKDLIRIPNGQRIVDYNSYIDNYKKNFERAKSMNSTRAITLRFFERINNDSIASEKGIYRLVKDRGQAGEQSFYGEFHALMIKKGEDWKIFMDYDNDNDNTIGEEDFSRAMDMSNVHFFISKK